MRAFSVVLLGVAVLLTTACTQIVARAVSEPAVDVEFEALSVQTAVSGEVPYAVLVGFNPSTSGLQARTQARPVDAETLVDLPGYEPLALGHHYNQVLSPDGTRWAVITWPSNGFHGGTLHLVDLVEWQAVSTGLDFFGHVSLMAFSPDGSQLVVSQVVWESNPSAADLIIIDTDESYGSRTVELDFIPIRARFTADGERLFLYGAATDPDTSEARPPQVAAIEIASGEISWSLQLEGIKDGWVAENVDPAMLPALNDHLPGGVHYQPGVVFDERGEWLYAVHPDEDRLTQVDLTRGRSETVAIAEPRTWFDRLMRLTARPAYAKGPLDTALKSVALSPDGVRLYVTGLETSVRFEDESGEAEVTENPLGLQVIDPRSGALLAEVETSLTDLALSPDGERVYLTRRTDPYGGVLDQSASADPHALSIVDAESLAVLGEVPLQADVIQFGFTTTDSQPYLIATTWPEYPGDLDITSYRLDALTGEPLVTREGGSLVLMAE
jgi:hypothetical protein